MLTIVGWLWRDPLCQNQYRPAHVDIWARMIHRHLTIPHRFVLFTDQTYASFDPLIEAKPLWSDYHLLKTESWRREFPQCYVRLKLFSKEMREIIGPRFASIDLDCVVLGNLDSILGRVEDFMIWRRPILKPDDNLEPYNGSLFMMNAGCRPEVWEDFRGAESLRELEEQKHFPYLMTDQGWMLYKLGVHEVGWTMDDGVFMWSWLTHKRIKPPDHARIVFFNGRMNPWDYKWITDNYV